MRVLDIMDGFNEVQSGWEKGTSNYWVLAKNEDIDFLADVLHIDSDVLKKYDKKSSQINFFDNYMFLTLNTLEYSENEIITKELNIFLMKDYIITLNPTPLNIINEIIKDIRNFKNCFVVKEKPEPCILLYYILDRLILKSYEIISKLEAKADKIEISILKNPRHEQVDELISLRRQVYIIRKYLNPLRYIGDSLLSNDNLVIEKENIHYFSSLNNKIEKLIASLESLVQDLALVREAFESEIANKTNELMKVFTIIATIFLPLNLMTSMQGMNCKRMPFYDCENGYYFILVIMILTAFILILLFKRKKWL
ncbi:magnesium transporter CorA family protein [Haloimpatiens sp. FM7315]|uniref:magnesium transporter CorA family protein n=1 Tax=Haloimpatiens sp. FM7315 TaxID=3298609 RepID=UPI00370CF987